MGIVVDSRCYLSVNNHQTFREGKDKAKVNQDTAEFALSLKSQAFSWVPEINVFILVSEKDECTDTFCQNKTHLVTLLRITLQIKNK